jgi:PEP-CTERM motif-containing protein
MRKSLWFIAYGVLAMSMTSFGAISAKANTVVLGASQNTSIGTCGGCNGDFGSFLVNYGGSTSNLGLIQFDLSSVPTGATVTSATLSAYQWANAQTSGTVLNFYQNTSAWSGATVYATKPSTDAAIAGSVAIGDSLVGLFRNIDITAAAQSWVDGSSPNYGLTVGMNPDASGDTAYLASDTFSILADRPSLTIDYTTAVPEPTTLSLVAVGLLGLAILAAKRTRIVPTE